MADDGVGQVTHQTVRNDVPILGVSRRRIAFGPYSSPLPVVTAPAQPSAILSTTEVDQNVAASLGKTTGKWRTWNNSEVRAFYDGLKQVGPFSSLMLTAAV